MNAPIGTASLLEIRYGLHTPTGDEVIDQKTIALAAINDLRSLGRLLMIIAPSVDQVFLETLPRNESKTDFASEMDAGLRTLGSLQMMVADAAHEAVDEMFSAAVHPSKSDTHNKGA